MKLDPISLIDNNGGVHALIFFFNTLQRTRAERSRVATHRSVAVLHRLSFTHPPSTNIIGV